MRDIPITPERRLEPAEKLRIALELVEVGAELMRERLRREDPGATDAEIHRRLVAWFRTRPGAEHGDAPGRPITRDFGPE